MAVAQQKSYLTDVFWGETFFKNCVLSLLAFRGISELE